MPASSLGLRTGFYPPFASGGYPLMDFNSNPFLALSNAITSLSLLLELLAAHAGGLSSSCASVVAHAFRFTQVTGEVVCDVTGLLRSSSSQRGALRRARTARVALGATVTLCLYLACHSLLRGDLKQRLYLISALAGVAVGVAAQQAAKRAASIQVESS